MVLNKRGVYWPYILALMVGLIVLTSSAYIFGEHFNQDEIDWDVCRQSLIMRSTLPEMNVGVKVVSVKNALPLKCGTKTVTIDYKDLERAEEEIADTIASCWYMVGEGEFRIFSTTVWDKLREFNIPCMICARIHLDEDVREFYSDGSEGEGEINIKRALEEGSPQGYEGSFWDYLNPERGARAFTYFKRWGNIGFGLDLIKKTSLGVLNSEDTEAFLFPRHLNPERGDLFVVYAQPTTKASSFDRDATKLYAIDPYMVLLQYDDFYELSKTWVEFSPFGHANVCSSIETVPS